MLDRSVLRWGGLSAMVGAGLGLVFNLMHPRSTAATADPMNELHLIAASDLWVFIHFMLAWAIAFGLIGWVAIGWSFKEGPGAAWGRIATASAIVGVAVAFITILVDGMAMKAVAESMMAGGMSPESNAASIAVAEVDMALFTGTIGSLFGLTPVLFGIAVLADGTHPSWLGYLALAAGVLGLVTGSIQYLAGISSLTGNILFPIASLAFTIWSFVMGWRLFAPATAGAKEPALTT